MVIQYPFGYSLGNANSEEVYAEVGRFASRGNWDFENIRNK